MQRRINSKRRVSRDLGIISEESDSLRIDVFTSEYCSFCEKALEIARSAAGRINYLGSPIEVVETSVDDQPALIEEMNLVALPMIQVGKSQMIGLPCQEDIERLVHDTVLMG
ncbi:MAG: hypothetical protein ACTSV2_19830 [Candidatus Thorarchaeota archaeon]